MIRINVIYKKNEISKITFKGHANFEEYGKDIVCAAVSATYLCTINAIYSLNDNSIKVEDINDTKIITIINNDKTTITLTQNMLNCLTSLEKQYPKYLKIDKEEK